jgi:hypothetical protein
MTQQKLNIHRLKQYLKNRSPLELIDDITELFSKIKPVKDYYQIKVYPENEKELIAKCKKSIEHEFFPSRGLGKLRLVAAKKAIADYKKLCKTDSNLIDVMLFYVEQGVKFTYTYGDINESFYMSMEGMYEKAVIIIIKAGLEDEFRERCRKIMLDTSDMGWGFHDTLCEIYEENF